MMFKYYFRKSSFKKDINSALLLMSQIENYQPKVFLEVDLIYKSNDQRMFEEH